MRREGGILMAGEREGRVEDETKAASREVMFEAKDSKNEIDVPGGGGHGEGLLPRHRV